MTHRLKNCEEADRLIQKGLDGMLTAKEREALDQHIATCPACAAAWDQHRELARRAAAWSRRPATGEAKGFTAGVLAQIAERQAVPQQRVFPDWAARLCAACTGLLMIALSYFLSPRLASLWSTPQVPSLPSDNPVTIGSGILQAARELPSDALSAWNGLLSTS